MTTISPKRRHGSPARSTIIFVLIGIACAACVVFAHREAGNLFWYATSPVVAFRNSLGTSEDSMLRAELSSTTAALADRDALYADNVQLKQLLGRSAGTHTTLGAILQRPPGIPYDTFIIDIGTQNGVAPGDLVFAGGTSVIGTVSEAYNTTSRITLLSSPGEQYNALLRGSVPLSLSGQGAGSMSGEVPAGISVAVGDPVVFPGVLMQFAGSVSRVTQEAGSSFITLYVQLPVDLFSLQYVEVQTNP
jgi:cell shape-determining protein MreC